MKFGPCLDVAASFLVAGSRILQDSNNVGMREALEEDPQRCISREKRSTSNMFIRDVSRSGQRFPMRGCILECHIFRFAKMILRDRCSTSL